MEWVLVNATDKIIRQQNFEETPPVLSAVKGLVWLELIENYAICDDTQIIGDAAITVDRIAGRVTKDYPGIPKPPLPEATRIAALWQAAHDYEYKDISGSAVGLLAIGVTQGKLKCTSVQNWIKGIWTEYYTRRANGSTDYDYSGCGVCPYTVPELMEELGV